MTDETKSLDRRCFVVAFVAALAAVASAYPGYAAAQATRAPEQEDWLYALTERKSLGAPLSLLRFADGVYVLTKPIAWSPNPGQPYKRVEVPAGFVTDFVSIPRTFWSIVHPDGEYAYAAIVHDYLYWTQDRPREESDQIFKLVMEDLKIDSTTITVVLAAVRLGGNQAWESNARLKAGGEKRVVKTFPSDPTTRWEDFKKKPNVFGG
jgi:hypothetical protein